MIVPACIMIAISLLVIAALTDLAVRLVSNWLCVAVGLDGLAMQGLAHTVPLALLAMLAVFVPAAVCWRHGLMGGGDVKLLGAVTLLVHPGAVPMLILAVALGGGLLGLVYLMLARLLPCRREHQPRNRFGRILRVETYRIRNGFALPYAVAICGGTACMLGNSVSA